MGQQHRHQRRADASMFVAWCCVDAHLCCVVIAGQRTKTVVIGKTNHCAIGILSHEHRPVSRFLMDYPLPPLGGGARCEGIAGGGGHTLAVVDFGDGLGVGGHGRTHAELGVHPSSVRPAPVIGGAHQQRVSLADVRTPDAGPSRWAAIGHEFGRTFISLAQRNYRLYFAGALLSNVGTWMQRTSQDWLVLTQLTDHSSSSLGIVTALQFLAIPFLAPFSGAVADRFSKRRILLITQSLLMANCALLWALVITGTVQLWHVYVFAFAQGVVASFDMPARQAFVSEMVADRLIPNAVGLNSMSFNAARLIGPGAAGLLIAAVGVAPGMLINALSFLAMLAALLAMKPALLHPAPARRGRGSVREGLSYIRHRPDLMLVMFMVFMLGTFGMNFQITNATMATKVFGRGAAEYGALGTIMAIGTFGAAIIAARRRAPHVSTLMLGLGGFAVASAALALSPNYYVYALLLIPTGLCALTVMTSANSTVQMSTTASMRGRVMAVYAAINMGGTPIGAPIVGWVGDWLGPRWSLLTGSVATGAACLGVGLYFFIHRGVRLRIERGRPLRLHVWTTEEAVAAQNAGESDK